MMVSKISKFTSSWLNILDNIKGVSIALICAIVIRTFLFEPFFIPSGSMIPNLMVGDYIFVSKWSYGYGAYSFPFGLGPDKRLFASAPKAGDIAVFRRPNSNEDYVKRIIALPGQKVQMRHGRLYIDRKIVLKTPITSYLVTDGMQSKKILQYQETLPNGSSYKVIEVAGDNGFLDNTKEFIVPKGHMFALGDNRDSSQDSRTMQLGMVPMDNLVGKTSIVFVSFEDGVTWYNPISWVNSIRWNRMMKGI